MRSPLPSKCSGTPSLKSAASLMCRARVKIILTGTLCLKRTFQFELTPTATQTFL